VVTPSSFLARLLGRKSFFLICLALFTTSSVLCGFVPDLQSLLLFRILQGLGGGMVPVAQSILANSFPPAKRGQAFALFGVAVVVAPVVGPSCLRRRHLPGIVAGAGVVPRIEGFGESIFGRPHAGADNADAVGHH